MNKRNFLFMAALATGLFFQSIEAEARYGEIPPVSDAVLEDVPVEGDEGPSDKVCFCHNINHNPHTICTANQALIHAHMAHVDGEVPGVEDALGVCPGDEVPGDEEEPGEETEEPCDEGEHEEPGDEGEEPADETEEPGDEGEGPTDEGEQPSDDAEEPGDEEEPPSDETEEPTEEVEETPAAEEEIPSEDELNGIPEATKVDGFEADGEIAVDEAGSPFDYPAWYFEGSGNMGCSLGGAGSGTTDLAPWALFAAVLMISPLRRIRKK